MQDDGLISQVQAAVLLGVSRQRIGQLIAEGKLTAVPLAGYRLVLRSQVLALALKKDGPTAPVAPSQG